MIQVYEGDGTKVITTRKYTLFILSEDDEEDLLQSELRVDIDLNDELIMDQIELLCDRVNVRLNRSLELHHIGPHLIQVYGDWA